MSRSPTTAVSPAEAAEAKVRFVKFFQEAALCRGLGPNEAAQGAIAATKAKRDPPALFKGAMVPDSEATVERALQSPASCSEEHWRKLGYLFGDVFYANSLLLPKTARPTKSDPCLDIDALRKLYDNIENSATSSGDVEMKDADEEQSSPSKREKTSDAMEVDQETGFAAAAAGTSSSSCTTAASCGSSVKKFSPSEEILKQLGDLCADVCREMEKLRSAKSAASSPASSSPQQVSTPAAAAAATGGSFTSGGSSSSTAPTSSDATTAGTTGIAAATPGGASSLSSSQENEEALMEGPASLRFCLFALFHPALEDPDRYQDVHRLFRCFRPLSEQARDILARWLSRLDVELLRGTLQTLHQYISITFLDAYHGSGEEMESAAEHVFDLFVATTSQLCKNALAAMDALFRANQIRIALRRQLRKEEMVKGTAAMMVTDSGGGGGKTPERSTSRHTAALSDKFDEADVEFFRKKFVSSALLEVLKPEEFRNDAMNDADLILRHDYQYTLYYDFIESENSGSKGLSKLAVPKNIEEIRQKSCKNTYTFGLLEYNFCLDANSKCRFLMINTADQQRQETRQEILAQVMQGQRRVNPYFVLKVRRDNLIQDTLQNLASQPPSNFRKTLKVVFEGEQGVDEGGVQKEFFQLLLEQLYDPMYAMFVYNSDNKSYWFNLGSFENNLQYELFGTLLGMAIYNHVILDIRFPMVVYQKLLAEDVDGTAKFSVDDLLEVSPDLGRSLLQLLEFEGDVAEVFCRDFVASYENFGAEVLVSLKPGGETIPVTNANREEFVDAYVDWFFNRSVFDKFRSFKKGFLRCMQGDEESSRTARGSGPSLASRTRSFFLSLFRPAELELLICGSEVLDFESLKNNTDYQDGYEKSSQTVEWFWDIVLNELNETEKRDLLSFCTGSARAPPKGLSAPEAKLTIGRQGPDSEALPTAHTCFNHLLIPEYADRDKLKTKLKLAVANNQGFGLI
ncbi:unnamed protein product [Amoebophrya sp. A25]|nr:unnamed protein product [Amoebophrya sp. A25]|eukprot:GSA25T00009739001.1